MALRNAFENLGLDSTLQAIRDRLPAALGGSGGVKVEQQGPVTVAQPTASNLKVDLSDTAANATAIKVDGTGGSFPVSGTVTANQGGTWDIRNISGTVSLPTGAATSTKQSDGSQKTQIVDGSGNVAGMTSNAVDVNIKSGNPTTITATQGTASNLKVAATLDAETTKVIGTVNPGNTANTTPWLVTQSVATSGGANIYRNISLVATGVNIKASAGQIYGWYLYNNASSVRYVKFYNKATAPTVGTDVPVLTLSLPANAAANVSFPSGVAFSLGIGIGATTGVADNDSGAPSANDVIVNVMYV